VLKWPPADHKPPLASTDRPDPERPRFERLRINGTGLALPLADPPPAEAGGPTEITIDSAKAFVGPEGTYYDDRWRWMDWRGRTHSWNWPAATTFGVWLAYRRMHGLALLRSGWLLLLVVLALLGVPLGLLLAAEAMVAVALGLYGNTLYLQHFRRLARGATRRFEDYRERVAALGAAGGVDRRAAWIVGAVNALLVLTLLRVALLSP
jgi:hypothetical protein